MAQNNSNGKGSHAGIGMGIAAATAAAALGAYFLYGSKKAPQNRRKVKGWMLKAKGEVLERMENMQDVSEEAYKDIVNKVVSGYKGAKGISGAEVAALASDLKKHWNALKPLLKKSSGKAPKRPSGGGAKSAAKKKSNQKSR